MPFFVTYLTIFFSHRSISLDYNYMLIPIHFKKFFYIFWQKIC